MPRIAGLCALLLSLACAPCARAQDGGFTAPLNGVPRLTRDPLTQIPPAPAPATVREGFTFAAAGDLLGPGRPIGPLKDPQFEKVAAIVREADAAFGNGEGNSFDLAAFKGYAAAENGGGNRLDPPSVARDYKDMGFDILSKPNNHAVDWGLEGLKATEETLAEAGLVTAGSGRSRAAARAPAFFETPRGRVAVVAAASTFVPWSVAGDAEGQVPDRPGISVLRTRKVALVSPADFEALKAVAGRIPGRTVKADAKEITLYGQAYRAADKPGMTYEMNDLDQYEILKAVRGAKQQSDFTAFTIHAHENAGTGDDSLPADFMPVFARRAIDAGADEVVVHGPHGVRGVEIYKGKPIFYGMGSLFFNVGGVRRSFGGTRMPDSWWDSAIAVSEAQGGKITTIRIYPITMRIDASPMSGAPRLASPADGKRILEQMQKDSEMFGTRISIENGIGVIRVAG